MSKNQIRLAYLLNTLQPRQFQITDKLVDAMNVFGVLSRSNVDGAGMRTVKITKTYVHATVIVAETKLD